jgi:uncharacterized protein (DUF58 family)
MSDPLLAPGLQARLAALELLLRRALPSSLRGDRRSRRKGLSLELADHRAYAPGDDVRHLDWAAYARLDQLVVKLYHDEEDVQVHLLVDDSASMQHGEPSKARFAREVAAALAWIGLSHAQRVGVTLLGDEPRGVPLSRGQGSFARIVDALVAPTPPGKRALSASCADFMARERPRGALVLVSDLLDPAGLDATLRTLQRTTTELTLVQVLAPDELEPALEGDLCLVDSETGHEVLVALTPAVLAAYRARARSFVAHCAELARRREVAFAQVRSDASLEAFLLRALVAERVLR